MPGWYSEWRESLLKEDAWRKTIYVTYFYKYYAFIFINPDSR